MDHYSMGRMNDLMQMVHICEKFGWTFEEYMGQPAYFIKAIKEKMVRDQKAEERELKKMKRGKGN